MHKKSDNVGMIPIGLIVVFLEEVIFYFKEKKLTWMSVSSGKWTWFFSFPVILVGLGFECRALRLQSRHSC
jgi:hypothetical protein